MARLAELEAVMNGLDDTSVAPTEVARLLDRVEGARRLLVGFESRLITIADRHASAGRGPSPEDAMIRSGACSNAEARRRAKRSRAGEAMPLLGESIKSGNARTENVDAIARAAEKFDTDAEQAAFHALAPELTNLAEELPPGEFFKRLACLVGRVQDDHGLTLFEKRRKAARVRKWTDNDGMKHLRAVLDPEWGGIVHTAIDREMRAFANKADADGDTHSKAMNDHLAAEALMEIALRSQDPDARTSRPLVGLILDHETHLHGPHDESVSVLFDGSHAPPETAQRLCCDADLQRLVIGKDSLPLAVGRRYRTATDAQRLALRAIYDGCAWDGCDQAFDRCQIHHIVPWEDGGFTDLINLTPLCSRHHHDVHEGQWQIKLAQDRTLWIWQPNGTLYATAPPDGPANRARVGQAAGNQAVANQTRRKPTNN